GRVAEAAGRSLGPDRHAASTAPSAGTRTQSPDAGGEWGRPRVDKRTVGSGQIQGCYRASGAQGRARGAQRRPQQPESRTAESGERTAQCFAGNGGCGAGKPEPPCEGTG